jgi:drug/metabolite transporter (DMT)-like permease
MTAVYPASQLGALSFLTPVFSIVFGVVLLGESVEPQFILGAALVLAGIALVSGWQWFGHNAFPQTRACQVLKTEGSLADEKG